MASPFKKLISNWARLRIAVVRAKSTKHKFDLTTELNTVWSELLNYPSAKMSNDDLELLRQLEDWTVNPKTTDKISNPKPGAKK